MFVSDHWHSELKFDNLRRRLRAMPMLFVTLLFIAGILLANSFIMPLWCAITVAIVLLLGAVLSMPGRVAYAYLIMAIIAMGYLAVEARSVISNIPHNEVVEMKVSVVSPIARREGYSVAEGRVEAWYDAEVWHKTDERVQLWLRTDTLHYGDRAHIVGSVKERISKYESYNNLMHRRGYIGGVSLSNSNILGLERDATGGLRRYAIESLDRYATDSASHSVVSAMVAGSRHMMSPELRSTYSATGLSHLMAVSGLHLGIVLLVVNVLLSPLRLIHRGHLVCSLLAIILVWLFAIMSGASPSVVRAAIMVSVLQLSHILSPHYNSLNALFVTLFAMLFYRPDYLFDISFQLSALAVLGILSWALPLIKIISFGGVTKALITTVVVGVVATLWTLPIISYAFGSIPLIGVVATPVVLLFAYIVVGAGIFVLLLPHPLSMPFGYIAEWAASLQNGVVEWFASLPFASVEYRASDGVIILYYIVFIAITVVVWSINRKKELTLSYDIDE